ncbi:hypothetical protein SLE2022_250100 [Rubroshorea leprosula]
MSKRTALISSSSILSGKPEVPFRNPQEIPSVPSYHPPSVPPEVPRQTRTPEMDPAGDTPTEISPGPPAPELVPKPGPDFPIPPLRPRHDPDIPVPPRPAPPKDPDIPVPPRPQQPPVVIPPRPPDLDPPPTPKHTPQTSCRRVLSHRLVRRLFFRKWKVVHSYVLSFGPPRMFLSRAGTSLFPP